MLKLMIKEPKCKIILKDEIHDIDHEHAFTSYDNHFLNRRLPGGYTNNPSFVVNPKVATGDYIPGKRFIYIFWQICYLTFLNLDLAPLCFIKI